MSKTDQEHREDIIRVCRLVYEKGWVAANDGNVSVRLESGCILCTPTSVSKGFVKAEWKPSGNGPMAKLYSLTPAGRKQLQEEKRQWQRYTGAIDMILGDD